MPAPRLTNFGIASRRRRGAAAGPSGAANEHLRIVLADEEDGRLLHVVAERLAQADVPPLALAALRVGRMVELRKSGGGVRALVVGDVLRRLTGRVLAQTYAATQLQQACLPFQFGWSTRAGTARVLKVATELNPRATVLSVDAAGAYDHVSRGAMLEALHARPELLPRLPYARQSYATPSSYTWVDDSGTSHTVSQGEGGEPGDPLMPGLYSLAAHAALQEVQAGLRDGEAVFAFLDDVYVVALPEQVRAWYAAVEVASWRHAQVQLYRAKTSIWNAAGEEPANIGDLRPVGGDPVWVDDWALPCDQQGLKVLGTRLGSEAFVRNQLVLKREAHDRLLHVIPVVEDLQATWLLLLLLLRYCAAPRANYLLRVLSPAATADYAAEHDEALAACIAGRLGHAGAPCRQHSLLHALAASACVLRCQTATQHTGHPGATHFLSYGIGCHAAARVLHALQGPLADSPPSAAAAKHAAVYLRAQGHTVPNWEETMLAPADAPSRTEPCDHLRGWQRRAAHACDERAFETFFSSLSPAARALLLSQAGPHSSRALTVLPLYPHMRMSHSPVRTSVLSFAGCACRSHLHRGLALAAGRLMCLARRARASEDLFQWALTAVESSCNCWNCRGPSLRLARTAMQL